MSETFDLTEKINPSFWPVFNSHARELVVYGGAGAGKSYALAQKVILKALKYPGSCIIVIRKYRPSLKLTCFKIIRELLTKYGVPHTFNLSELSIKLGQSAIYFLPVVNTTGDEEAADRLKSMTDITDVWIEEATELSREEYQ